jgi:hypothetical protein
VAGTAVPGRIRVLAVLVSTLAAFALPTTIGAASAQQRSESRPAHASASGSQETVSASSRVESSPRSRAGHRSQDPRSPHRGDRHDADPGQRGNGRSPSTSNGSAGGGTGTEGRGQSTEGAGKDDGKGPKQEKQPKKDEEPKQAKTTGPPPGQRGSGASDRARERANPASPVRAASPPAQPTPTPAPSVGTQPPARVPTVPLPDADRPTRAPASDTPPVSPATTTPVAVPAAGSDQGTTLAFLSAPATAEPPAAPTTPEPPADLLGDVELPVGNGDADRFGALGRSALDAILDGAARSFQVPFLLLLALGGYLVLQRGFGRGSLPMVGTDLPLSVDPGPEAGADDVRYVL